MCENTGDGITAVVDQAACQQRASDAGAEYFSYIPGKCFFSFTCKNPDTEIRHRWVNWKVYWSGVWAQVGPDYTKCENTGDGITAVVDQAACQQRASDAGAEYFSYITGKCFFSFTCKNPDTETTHHWIKWQVYWSGVHPLTPMPTPLPSPVPTMSPTPMPTPTPLELENFSFNMDKGEIKLTFSKVVRADEINPTALTLQDAATSTGGSDRALTLDSLATSSIIDGLVITITISVADVNALKGRGMANTKLTTFILITSEGAKDMEGKSVIAIADGAAIAANDYTEDATDAELIGFSLNMNSGGSISLTFSEPVKQTELTISSLTLQASATGGASTTLTTGTNPISTAYSTVVTFGLNLDDLNKIKTTAGLCTGVPDTFVSVTASLIQDMNERGTMVIPASSALQVRTVGFTADSTKPTVDSFTANIDTGVLVLVMSEPVADAVNVTKLSLKSKDGIKVYTLTIASTFSLDVGKLKVTITIGTADLNQIKAESTIAFDKESTLLQITAGFARDRVVASLPNTITAVTYADKMIPTVYTVDSSVPLLVKYTFDLGTAKLTTYWSETVDVSKFSKTAFRFVAAVGDTIGIDLGATKDASVAAKSTDPSVVVFILGSADSNAIKASATICTTSSNCLLVLTAGAVTDMAVPGKLSVAILKAYAKEAAPFSADGSKPTLSAFSLNMDGTPSLTLTFSEAVNLNLFNETTMKLLQTSDANSAGVDISNNGIATAADSTTIVLMLGVDDANAIKADVTLGTSTTNTFLRVTSATINDMALNPLDVRTPISAATTVVNDRTAPTLISVALDMETGIMTLVFNEMVKLSEVIAAKILVRTDDNDVDAIDLRGSTQSSTVGSSTTIILIISFNKLNQFTLNSNRTVPGTAFIVLGEGAVTDTSPNKNTNVHISQQAHPFNPRSYPSPPAPLAPQTPLPPNPPTPSPPPPSPPSPPVSPNPPPPPSPPSPGTIVPNPPPPSPPSPRPVSPNPPPPPPPPSPGPVSPNPQPPPSPPSPGPVAPNPPPPPSPPSPGPVSPNPPPPPSPPSPGPVAPNPPPPSPPSPGPVSPNPPSPPSPGPVAPNPPPPSPPSPGPVSPNPPPPPSPGPVAPIPTPP
jgi:hypothetical protein